MQRTMPSSISCAYERPKVSLSCLQCQQRKRKCDKNSPCQACSQACITCTPISRARLPRGRHAIQQGNGDLRQRVARLEKLLSNQKDAEEQVIPTPPQTDSPISHSTWNTISEEFVGIRELLDTLTGDEPDDSFVEAAETDRSQSFDLLLYGDASCFVQPHVLESPPMGMVSALVEIYLHRVDQVFKITHTPSLRAVMLRDDNRTPAQEALRFTLFFTAVNTLSEQECLQHFDSSKNSLSSRFQLAAEVMLSRAELLTTTDLTTLQAFLIYLVEQYLLFIVYMMLILHRLDFEHIMAQEQLLLCLQLPFALDSLLALNARPQGIHLSKLSCDAAFGTQLAYLIFKFRLITVHVPPLPAEFCLAMLH